MKVSLRAHGLSTILKKPHTLEELLNVTTDTAEIVENTLRELEKKNILRKMMNGNDQFIYSVGRNTIDSLDYTEQEKVIENLFPKTRTYAIISWFFEEEKMYFDDEYQLRKAVDKEYASARVLQLYDDKQLYDAYQFYKQVTEKEDGHIPSLQGLCGYADRVGK